ncbi:response regulator transcription factor [Streptomyces sp. A7024]|uniref:Response regulator transcription factor n=1 Tax=Streptomyces coryli TaxID=1128680 RepID=A0A6G4TUF4_9ACTN|nr:response regulator transcription factor [Streptomyces coryli]
MRSELSALGCDPFTAEAVVSLFVSSFADTLCDAAHVIRDPRLTELLLDESAAILASADYGLPRTARAGRGSHRPEPAPPLTEREAIVLRHLSSEQSLREIGDALYLSVNTVKSHVRAIYRKLDVTTREAAVRRARGLRLE